VKVTQGKADDLNGVAIHRAALDASRQADLVADLRQVVAVAPLFAPVTPWGKTMSVRMTSAGRLGWVTDRNGYRYDPQHPSGGDWPAIPASLLAVWRRFGSTLRDPDCCLVNYYADGARMGLHQDRDEGDFSWPVVSISLGDDALFRVGGLRRGDPTRSTWLVSGDLAVIGGDARLAFHGIDRIRQGSSTLLPKGGRINVTMRVVA
jgi:alkylated DNA repair protein (DNA oxidative demethylase)